VQIRTRQMHEHAEHGVAAHWAYKEAGVKGYGGVSASGDFDAQVAEARKAVLRQLLAWERDFAESDSEAAATETGAVFDDRIYVFTPQAAVIDLPAGATPIDFAYAVHTTLGHRCRGAKVDGAMVPLNTPLQSGQTVDVITIKEGGPSLDWLNGELGYLQSPRSKAKVRAWFNALQQQDTIARGREAVEKLLQREGKTAMKLDDLAARLGFRSADALFEVVGKDEFSLRNIETLLRPAEPAPQPDDLIALRRPRIEEAPKGGVLVVGVESLLTSLSRCCRPAPPDAIGGYVTRGRGVAIHRADCSNFRQMAERTPERVISVAWGAARGDKQALYPVDVLVEAADRSGLLRDISEVFAKDKMNVAGVSTQTVKDARGGTAWMTFTIEVSDSAKLSQVLGTVSRIDGVRSARRK
jgi:GTP pyrophosphokinase